MRIRDKITEVAYDVLELDMENGLSPSYVCLDGITRPTDGCEVIETDRPADAKIN